MRSGVALFPSGTGVLAPAAVGLATLFFIFLDISAGQVDPPSFDHGDYLQSLDASNHARGMRLYQGLCVNCHGADGKTPALPPAPAFGSGTLKFGSDPHAMFVTLTEGNGLMAPQRWMSPGERYDVIHYIRETFMKSRPDYVPVDASYLAKLPKAAPAVADERESLPGGERDFGPALASQLGRDKVSVLTIVLPDRHAIAYDLHTLDGAGLWQGGFLDLSGTQHSRLRGEGVPKPGGTPLPALQTWQWAHGGTFDYPRERLLARGPMPSEWMHYHGHYLYGDQVVLSYSIDGRQILELPGKQSGSDALTHTFTVAPSDRGLRLAVADLRSEIMVAEGGAAAAMVILGDLAGFTGIALHGLAEGLRLSAGETGRRLVLAIPPAERELTFQVVRMTGKGQAALDSFRGLVAWKDLQEPLRNLQLMCTGGPGRWPQTFTIGGETGGDAAAYVIDTLTFPESTPSHTWFRTSALAFHEDGTLYIATHGGDIWSVRGLDEGLKALQWKRFAAGLYEPFGLQVVDDDVYATCKDRLVRLRDLNADGEADFYASFSADEDVSSFFHAYNFDLMRDRAGYFYYVKAGQYTSHALPGAVVRVSPDGEQRQVICTGFRTPNGMGILPADRLTVSDNQGNWIPASKVSLVRPGGFYGYAQTHSRPGFWEPDGGRIDHREEAFPATFDQPLIWMPQAFDNSSGGQLWVDDSRWGPLSGRLLHTSFGKGWLYYFLLQDLGDTAQAAVVRLPLDFKTGIMRARVNPADGQVYAVGLNGWNGNGRKGLEEGGAFRVRYTGKPLKLLTNAQVRDDGLELTFNFPVEAESAARLENYQVEQWNYRWLPRYGSEIWSAREPDKTGKDQVAVASARRLPHGHGVLLHITDLQPVNQLHLRLSLQPEEGGPPFEEELYWTINGFPDGRRWQQPAPYAGDGKRKPKKGSADKWIRLFDGGTLTGWTPRAQGEVSVFNGEIQIRSRTNLWLVHQRILDDFILEAEVKLPPGEAGEGETGSGINSGIAFRCQGAEGRPKGYQCEIDGSDRRRTGGLYAMGSGGWLWPAKGDEASASQFVEMSKGSFRRDDWNRFRIECRGPDIRLYVNGIPTTRYRDDRFSRGYIALQHHGRGGVYRFRDIRVKPWR